MTRTSESGREPGQRRRYERRMVVRHNPTVRMQKIRLRTFGTRPERHTLVVQGVNSTGKPVFLQLTNLSREGRADMLRLARQVAEPFDITVKLSFI